MSHVSARAALSRLHMSVALMSAHYAPSALASDLKTMAGTDPDAGQVAFLKRRGEMCAAFGVNEDEQRKPFAFAQGIAIIPITGTLLNRFNWSYGFVTGYNFIRAQLRLALADEDVKGIVFDVNSYGGECAGCMELADEIRASRLIKPSMAVVDSNAYSAGYALASAATRMVGIPSAGVGSIGVIAMHVDMSKMLEDWGIKITMMFESDHKADGNPYAPLPADVRKRFEADIHASYETFVALVADNRGMDVQKVRDTKSLTYRAEEAVSLGLLDAVVSPNVAVQAFLGELSGSQLQLETKGSTTMTTPAPVTAPVAAAPVAAAPATAPVAAPAVDASAEQAAGANAERTRISAIMGCDEAKGREKFANHLAFTTSMSADDAKVMLSKAGLDAAAPPPAAATPEAEKLANKTAFEKAMDTTGNPNIGAEGAGGEQGEKPSEAALVASAWENATGNKPATK